MKLTRRDRGRTAVVDGRPVDMQQWEYMWIYVTTEKGQQVYVANGERLPAQSYPEALNIVGKQGWELVAVVPPASLPTATNAFAQLCLKRPISG